MRATHAERLADGRAALSAALEDDLGELAETRQDIDEMVSAQVTRLSEGRNILKRALEADIDRINASRSEIEELVKAVTASHADRLAEGRTALVSALDDDLGKLAETRQSIDDMMAAQVSRLSEGRNILKRLWKPILNASREARPKSKNSSTLLRPPMRSVSPRAAPRLAARFAKTSRSWAMHVRASTN